MAPSLEDFLPSTDSPKDVPQQLKVSPDLQTKILQTRSQVPLSNGDIVIPSKAPTSLPAFEIEDHPTDSRPPIRVAIVGAGLSGLTAGILLPAKVPNLELTIFEKNSDAGGTWHENVYPGVRCDIPANVYQSTFSPNTQWTEEYAQGAEIKAYWQGLAKKYDLHKYLRFGTRIVGANWSEQKSKWTLRFREGGEEVPEQEEDFDVLILAIGRFNAWKLPDYPGIDNFKGLLRHSSNWDPKFEPAGKSVAVIGNGASGIQVVPNLQPLVKHLDHYARNKTWIAGSFGGEGPGRRLEPNYYPLELLKSFEDPETGGETYYKFRKELESKFYTRFEGIFRGTEDNIVLRKEFQTLMAERLKNKPELLETLIPDFSPNCRRLTPGPGYLEALTQDNVSFIQTPILHFTEDGIVTTDGVLRKVDAVICSTGANVNLLPPFPITSDTAKTSLQEQWAPGPFTYLGLAAPNFPNLVFLGGPQSAGYSGTVPHQTEITVTYIAKLLRKVQTQGIKSFVPSQDAVDDFTAFSDAFFEKTVWTEDCSSWANGGIPGGRIFGHWPGSASHATQIRKEPRWEDWEWKYKNKFGNRFGYFGNGWTNKEAKGEGDLTAYLKRPEHINLRSYHEEWFEGL